MIQFCRACGAAIRMMCQMNTGFCCQRHADEWAAAHKGSVPSTAYSGAWEDR